MPKIAWLSRSKWPAPRNPYDRTMPPAAPRKPPRADGRRCANCLLMETSAWCAAHDRTVDRRDHCDEHVPIQAEKA